MQGVIANLTRTPGRIRSAGPLLGEHNDEILRDRLGYRAEEVAQLVADGVIGRSGTRSPGERTERLPTTSTTRRG